MREPVSVLIVVYTEDAKVLLLRRRFPFEFWQSVTGSIETGEPLISAARRELLEETGLRDEGVLVRTGISRRFKIDPRWLDRYPSGVTENTEHEWRYCLPSEREIRINPREHSTYRWMPVDEAIDAVWSWTNREALEDLRTEKW